MKEHELERVILAAPLKPVTKLVLLGIKNRVNWKTWSGQVSSSDIAKDLNLNRRSVTRAIKELVEMRVIYRHAKRRGEALHHRSVTAINIDHIPSDEMSHPSDERSLPPSDDMSLPPSDEMSHPSDEMSHPSDERSLPPSDDMSHNTTKDNQLNTNIDQTRDRQESVESFAQFIREEEEREDAEARRWPKVEPKLNRMQLMLIEQAIERREINREYSEMNKFALRKFGIRLKPWKR